MIKEYVPWLLSGGIDKSVIDAEFMASSGGKTLAEVEVTDARIKLLEQLKERDAENCKNNTSKESHLFIEGFNPLDREKREMFVTRMKKQYKDKLLEDKVLKN